MNRLSSTVKFTGRVMTLETLFEHSNALPAVPKIVQDMIESFSSETVSIDEIVRKLEVDPVVTVKLLRLANSAYYQVSRSVGTVDDAITMLGFAAVRSIVITSGLVNGFKAMPGMDLPKFWCYSLHAAVSSRWLAKEARQNTEQAFTIGMMHAIGQLVMRAAMPKQMLQVDKIASMFDSQRLAVERTSFGFDFAEVGAELARHWKFPDSFSVAIRNFPEPLAHRQFLPMAAILHLAAWSARTHANESSQDELRNTCPTDVALRLGMEPYILLDKMPPLAELAAGLEEVMA